jgi:phage shock protein PspC (stress-responsive transcriptional regulator)
MNIPTLLTLLRIFFVPLLVALLVQENISLSIFHVQVSNEILALGIFLAFIGVILLINSLGILPFGLWRLWELFWRLFWPLVVIGLGLALLISATWGGREWWKEVRLPQAGQPLYRSRSNRIVAGVCGGLGEYFHIDPTLIRLVWAIGTLSTMGSGILAYILEGRW